MKNLNGFKYNAEFSQFEKIVNCKVLRVNAEITTTKNDGTPLAGQPYYLATVEFEGQQVGAVVYEKNREGIELGKVYPVAVSIRQNQPPWLSVLVGAPRATAEMFNFDFEAALAAEGVGAEQVA
jgi:hypothetical protein